MRIVDIAGLYVMMALGYNLMFGYTGLFNLGFAGYFAIGAYCYAILASPLHEMHLPFLVVLPLAVVLTSLVSYLLGIPSLSLIGDYLGLVTLAFAEILRILVNNLEFTNASYGIINIDPISLPFFTFQTVQDYYYLILPICAITYLVIKRLEQSRIGRAWLAIRNDEEAARTSGLDTRRLKLLACAIGVAPVGLAGVIFAGMQTFVSPESFTSRETWLIIAMAIVGGLGNADGAVLGALLLTILPEPLRGTPIESARALIYGLLLIFFSLFRPQGILPRRHRAGESEAVRTT
ncbi:MAG: branched-chain amino acid ABC transporter permease [Chloroflexi bacterium]|nr:branched-chain amino acid ABC transporter permease [Chloroflexota bacterium]